MIIKIIIVVIILLVGVGVVIALSGGDEVLFIENIKAKFIQEESQSAITDLSTTISNKDYENYTHRKIETEFIDFEVPVRADHEWRPDGLDRYGLIIRNLSIKGFQDYIFKVSSLFSPFLKFINQSKELGAFKIIEEELLPLDKKSGRSGYMRKIDHDPVNGKTTVTIRDSEPY